MPGALEALEAVSERFRLGLASSSNRVVIDTVLASADLARLFGAVVSSEEVPRGKPAPDVYLEAAARVGVSPREAVAIEDSHNGIAAAKAAGMRCLAIPNMHFPPGDALFEADAVVESIGALTVELIEQLDR